LSKRHKNNNSCGDEIYAPPPKKAGYIWTDYKTNTETAKEINITPVLGKIQEYNTNWSQHVNRM